MACGKGHVHRQKRGAAQGGSGGRHCLPSYLPDAARHLRGEVAGGCLLLQSWWVLEVRTVPLPAQLLSLLMASAEFAMKLGADPVAGVSEDARGP